MTLPEFSCVKSSAQLTLHGLVNYMDKAGPHSIALSDVGLAAGESRDLTLDKAIQLPFRDGMANLSFTYNVPCGSLLLSTGSVDRTGSYVFEAPPGAVGKAWGQSSQFWEAGSGTDTMYSVWNPTDEAENLMVTVHYEPEGVYRFPLHLGAQASAMISMLEIIRRGAADAEGHLIPPNTRLGSLSITSQSPDIRDLATFVVSGGIYNPVAGTCCQVYITCNGATGANTVRNPDEYCFAEYCATYRDREPSRARGDEGAEQHISACVVDIRQHKA